jgi:RES domain-containing protein
VTKPARPSTAQQAQLPAITLLRRNDTHRLIPSKYSEGGASVLTRIANDAAHLAAIFDLDHATNDRLQAENALLPGIGAHDLVFGVPHYRIVNAAFVHAHPLGSRFNGPTRGAWYAAFDLATSQAEVAFHKTTEYAEINRFDDSITYDDYLADFSAAFHDLRRDIRFVDCLAPDSYVASQTLALRLFEQGSLGVVYPSVRHKAGTCIACFRPPLVGNVRKDATYRFTWSGSPVPEVAQLASPEPKK